MNVVFRENGTWSFLKRLIAIILAVSCAAGIIMYRADDINSNYSIVACAYSTGNYKVNTSSGVNVRSGAGTSYSKVGAATNGTSFSVDQINGSWGHTNSIKCTNGYKSGWVSLKYCTQTSSGGGSSGGSSSSSGAGTYKVYNCTWLNVRNGAGTNCGVKTSIKNGTYVYITSKSGNWGYASNYGGYVSMKYCSFVSVSNLAPFTTNTSNNNNSATTNKNYSTPLTNGMGYYLSPACATSSVLDVAGAKTGNGTNIQIWKYYGSTHQKFHGIYVGNGYYVFKDSNSKKVIDVSGGVVANGTNIQLYEYNGSAAQMWRLYSAGNGYFYIQSKLNSSYYLDVSGANSGNGTNVQLYKGNSSSAQKFKFYYKSGDSTDTSLPSLDTPKQSNNVTPTTNKLKPLQQGDYAHINYGSYKDKTVKSSGCGAMATINAVRYLTGNTINVNDMAYWAGRNQYVYDVGSKWTIAQAAASKFGDQYGFACTEKYNFSETPTKSQYDIVWNKIVNHLNNGEVAVTLVKGHFIAIVAYDSSTKKVLVYDSAASSSRGTTTAGDWKSYDELRYGSGVGKSKLKLRSSITFLCAK